MVWCFALLNFRRTQAGMPADGVVHGSFALNALQDLSEGLNLTIASILLHVDWFQKKSMANNVVVERIYNN